ncbi:MAG: baseplate J/gp47 family protein [Acidobacteriota bacterium]
MEKNKPLQVRDGTSQTARRQVALDPDSVSIDERTIADRLDIVRCHAEHLRYFDDSNREDGTWSAFLPRELSNEEILAFLDDPEAFDPDRHPLLRRPHFTLFLTFLELLHQVQGRMNGFARRHLDFYYRQVLRLTPKPALPDRVRVFFELAPGVDEALVKAGTLLDAGPASTGVDRHYATGRDLVVNRSRIARLSSIHVERTITDFERVRTIHRNDPQGLAPALFAITLGDPSPGDPLPAYPGGDQGDLLPELHALVQWAGSPKASTGTPGARLFLWFHELRELMRLKGLRDDTDTAAIQRLIQKAEGVSFAGLPNVERLDDLYRERTRSDVWRFIETELEETLGTFISVMQDKIRLDHGWRRIVRLLTEAGRRRDDEYEIPTGLTGLGENDFDNLLESAIARDNFDALQQRGGLDGYWGEIEELETYFHLSVESFDWVMAVVSRAGASPEPPTSREWARVDEVLTEAHRRKVWARRRDLLVKIREQHNSFLAMLYHALGEEPAASDDDPDVVEAAVDRLASYFGRGSDRSDLMTAWNESDWERAAEIVEIAWRNRERLSPPVPRKEEWIDLHPAADATVVRPESGVTSDLKRWETFGRASNAEAPPSPSFGWGVSSPILALAGGRRTIDLDLGFVANDDAETLSKRFAGAFQFEASTENGWIALSGESKATEPHIVSFRLTLPVDAEPVTPPGDGSSTWPVLRLMLRHVEDADGKPRLRYPALRDLVLASVAVTVRVSDLQGISASNDEGIIDTSKALEPFGSSPSVGSRFALGHPELVEKKLDRLTLDLPWMGVPEDLTEHYRNYPLEKPVRFTAGLHAFDRGLSVELEAAVALFDLPDRFTTQGDSHQPRGVDTSAEDPRLWSRYFELRLEFPDFQHQTYPGVAARKSIELAAAIATLEPAGTINSSDFHVNPPYTPRLENLTIGYESSLEIHLDQDVSSDARILHVHPFGVSDAEREREGEGVPFLPRYDDEGELLIGLEDVQPPQTVTLFFQMAEGSADPDLEHHPVRWWYLSGDRWTSLDEAGHVLADTTRGLINSGIVELALRPAEPSTRLPGDLYWLRATVASHSAAICDTVAIHTQAVSATFLDPSNVPDQGDRPLPAGSLTGFVEAQPAIARVLQPYASYGGRQTETAAMFDTRVSERLRHKGRALTAWDYERLVLERFPEVYKVKCIPALEEPGRVEIVLIPDMRGRADFDPFEPKAPADLLVDIERYLSARAPSSARIMVKNPRYVAIKIRVAVRFRGQGNEDFDTRRLTEDLNRYLSPWAYDEGADITIGGRIFAYSLVDFIDRRPYVDYLADVRLFRRDDGETFESVDRDGEVAATPDAILVAARQHQIDLILETGYRLESFSGVNYMQIELDFVVG